MLFPYFPSFCGENMKIFCINRKGMIRYTRRIGILIAYQTKNTKEGDFFMQAKELLQRGVISVLIDATVEEIAVLMIEHNISGIPVVNDLGTVLGVVSELDIMRKQLKPESPNVWQLFIWEIQGDGEIEDHRDNLRRYLAKTAGEIMTSPAVTVDELDDIETVGQLMFEHRIKRVFVTKNGKLSGVISRSAFVKQLLQTPQGK